MKMIRTAILASALAVPAFAQGNLSTQGYGYPQGQLTTRALTMGGSIGEIDPASGLNPAAIGRLTNRTVTFQIEPEFRTNTSGSAQDRTTIARYPLINVGVPFGQHWVIGVSGSSLLDRSWITNSPRQAIVGTETININSRESSDGAMNDLRLATAWTNRDWLYVGVGMSAITGRNVVITTERFPDSTFSSFTNTRVLDYSGSALSAGIQVNVRPISTVVGLTYRMGNGLHADESDTTIARGDVPDHMGVSAAFTGIDGTILSARIARDGWSSMSSMLSSSKAHDSWDAGVGAEFVGPRILGQPLTFRTGFRTRGLPFEASGKTVSERSVGLGTGMNFGGGRMSTDFGILRQWRSADLASVSERAWTFSFSLTARP
jgi:hypothetical protein